MTKHTPGPWKLKNIMHGGRSISGPVYHVMNLEADVSDANAAFIVRACNSHDALVEALEHAQKALAQLGVGSSLVNAALALAKGE